MNQLPEKYQSRPAVVDDMEDLHEIFTGYWQVLTGVNKFTLDDFKTLFSSPGFDLGSSLQVVTSPKGKIVACVLVLDQSTPPVHPNVFGCVRKEYQGQGLGTFLLEWAEERAMKALPRCPDGSRVSMYVQTGQSHKPSIKLLEKLEFLPIRYTWFMMRNLDGEIPDPDWPEGIKLQTYQTFSDLETILKATDEAFEDHWGYIDRSGDTGRIERFRHTIENDQEFDPSLWYLAMDNGEIAGAAYCIPRFGEEREIGVVETLVVRRPWRRQGLALALLHQAFGEFQRRGYKSVGLGVDTQNLSGATRLYEKAGMKVSHEYAVYEKELRPGKEIRVQSA